MSSEVPIEPAEPVEEEPEEPAVEEPVERTEEPEEPPGVQIEVVDEEVPKKRAPRPKAAPKEPKPKAKAKAPKPRAAPKARPSSPVSVVAPDRFGTMSSMDMVAELLHRRGHQERENKRLLYRSFLS